MAGTTRTRVSLVLAALLGLVGSAVLVHTASQAAFSATTVNAGNTWTAGAVMLSTDDGGMALFSADGLTPASAPLVKCIEVTYDGTVAAPVRLSGEAPGGTGLGAYLDLTVDVGTGGCGAFTGGTLYNGTVADFGTTHSSTATGLATTWTPAAMGESRTFRFTVTVRDDNAANGLTCTMPFTWEARSA